MNGSILEHITKKNKLQVKFGGIIESSRILVLSPHHDDEVLGCGGTLLKYLEDEIEVQIVYLTDGRQGIKESEIFMRKEEAISVWKDYKKVSQVFCDFEDTKLNQNIEDARKKIQELIAKFKPQIIFTPWILDLHMDHRYTTIILTEALKNVINMESIIIMSYEVMCPLYSNHSVNITRQYDKKMELIDLYKSQHSYLNIKKTTSALNVFRASMFRIKSIKQAEGFFVTYADDFCEIIELFNKESL
jgi:N-acetylglucosamine malate deacetylase 1